LKIISRCKKIVLWTLLFPVLLALSLSGLGHAAPRSSSSVKPSPVHGATNALLLVAQKEGETEMPEAEEPVERLADPLEPVNRLFFHVNDRLYFWVLKPVASGYQTFIPQRTRLSVRNFFSNVATPIRVANCLLQFKFKGAGNETIRFFVNSVFGLGGFVDAAKREFNLEKRDEDFGQTLGFYGIGPIIYINWPIFGPSSLRDTAGSFADGFLDPWNYFVTSVPANLAVKGYDRVNDTSLQIGEYEDLKEAALDPYIALRNAYHQFRENRIRE
jgi:phospholipid-binding lipoprotein MlaA